ncbi:MULTISPECIES: helix-turn-helix transcriptional regulator [Acinetobacter calcoaceticus/baumannii complex]|nr:MULTISPECIES: hypothetical protein [Acinetobacter calcoaceticus/baumannii complex]AMM30525.1 AlpA family transcriptional regulator [Acinetobacter pittii]EXR21379.1 hypothetical protein J669_1709 [Acinetobacter baumannii 1295549]EXR93013.1 hypothetical protein J680_0340 [Acinetobacter baumannii 277047]EXS39765.1 hypothetical protein J677_0523 [Acinetobacter baumannii 426863]MBR7723631.1 AlpA family transcriptional regulator [Acinetobacter nosocomialis]
MNKLRLTKKEVCCILSIKSDKLRKLIKEDESFPRPIKDGQNRQSAVYFDFKAIEVWWQNRLENSLNNYI